MNQDEAEKLLPLKAGHANNATHGKLTQAALKSKDWELFPTKLPQARAQHSVSWYQDKPGNMS